MKVSIIIVNYNTRELLRNCLESIYTYVDGIEYEIIVVDNASKDDSAQMVKNEYKKIILLESKHNIGFGGANNLGASQATGEYLFLLNSDTVFIHDALSVLIGFIDRHPDCGICGGNLVDLENEPVHSYGVAIPSPWSDIHRFCKWSMDVRYGKSWNYNHTKKPKKVGYITGADLLIRKKIFDKLKGFDPGFFMYYEETELTHRVRNAGWTVWSVPEAKIVHIKGASLEFLDGANKISFESKYRYLLKVYGMSGANTAHRVYRIWCLYKQFILTVFGKKDRVQRYKKMVKKDSDCYLAETRK